MFTAMSILLIWSSAQPNANFFQGQSVSFGVPYVALTISLNVIVTLLICGRLLAVRNKVRAVLGAEHAKTYTNVASIIVESGTPFTILGIAYAVSYARNSPTSIAFVQVWGDFCVWRRLLFFYFNCSDTIRIQALSPQLIILRVALGRAWSKDTVTRISGMVFEDHEKARGTRTSTGVSHTGINIGLRPSQGITDSLGLDSLATPTSTKNDQTFA